MSKNAEPVANITADRIRRAMQPLGAFSSRWPSQHFAYRAGLRQGYDCGVFRGILGTVLAYTAAGLLAAALTGTLTCP